MKWRSFSGWLAVGLALVVGQVRADERTGRGDNSQQRQAAPNQNPAVVPQPGVFEQTPPPSSVIQKPSGVLNKPSGELNKPSGVLRKPSGVLNKPPGVISTLPAQAQSPPKQNFVGGQKDIRHFPHDGNFHDRNFHRGTFRGRRSSFVVVYVNGAPCWYPVYTAYPYYYATSLPSTYDSGYPADTGYIPLAEEGDAQVAASYGEVGRQWGQDLRRDVATWEQFVDYVSAYIINAARQRRRISGRHSLRATVSTARRRMTKPRTKPPKHLRPKRLLPRKGRRSSTCNPVLRMQADSVSRRISERFRRFAEAAYRARQFLATAFHCQFLRAEANICRAQG